MIIGRQVPTDHGKFIDLLALDATGALIIIELKKDRTPREIVAQVLDYASWVRTLTTPEIYERAEKFLNKRLVTAFRERFGEAIPDRLNATHSMLIVASSRPEEEPRAREDAQTSCRVELGQRISWRERGTFSTVGLACSQ